MAQELQSKYNRFLLELQVAAGVADNQNSTHKAAEAIDIIANPSNGLVSVLEQQTSPVPELVDSYVAYQWDGGPKPTWLAQVGL